MPFWAMLLGMMTGSWLPEKVAVLVAALSFESQFGLKLYFLKFMFNIKRLRIIEYH